MMSATDVADGSGALSSQVGERIRRLRTQRGVSLGSLATAARLGKGTLSELERGLRNPTLDTLFAITTALGVPLGAVLIDGDSDSDGDPDAASKRSVHGAAVDARLLDRWTDSGRVHEVYRIRVREVRQHSEPHAPGVTETLTVVSGTVLAGAESRPISIGPGECASYRGDVAHTYQGVGGDAIAMLVMTYPSSPAASAANRREVRQARP